MFRSAQKFMFDNVHLIGIGVRVKLYEMSKSAQRSWLT